MLNTISKAFGKEEAIGDKRLAMYFEPLNCGCNLVVYGGEAYVEYDFSKYGKSHSHMCRIPVDKIEQHLKAVKANLDIYKNTKASVGRAVISIKGLRDMTINLNSRHEGVCVNRFYFPVASDTDYARLESCLVYAKNKAAEIMAMQ